MDRAEEIRGIGLSGQMHGLVALDQGSRVLRPAILWNDQRTERQCQEVYDRVGGQAGLLQLTNNRMLPGYTGGKILWLKGQEPRHFEKIRRILNPKDYIRFRLTGEFATEVSDASGTGLFNVRERQWSRPLLEALEIPPEWLPACHESHEISGRLLPSASEEFGLPVNLPVAGGGGDAVIQATGTGLVAPGILGTTIGTAGNVTMALNQYLENPGGKLQIFCNTLPGRWHAMGVTLSAGGALRWFRDAFGSPEKNADAEIHRNPYDLLIQEASHAPSGSDGLLFLPYLTGERCPHTDPAARGVFFGLTPRHNRSHFIRSILEGVLFSLLDVAEVLKETGLPVHQVRTSGGGASSELWRRIHADIFNREVVTVSGSAEGGAYGAALLAGVGTGVWPTVEESVRHLKIETRTPPDPKNAERYQRLFEIYRGLYPALKPEFDQAAALNQTDQKI
jgi:xylulokinase